MCAHGNRPRGHGQRSGKLFSPGAAARATIAIQYTDSGTRIGAREKKTVSDCFSAHFGPPCVHRVAVSKLTHVSVGRCCGGQI